MDVRLWGLVDDRLIELRVERLVGEAGMQILGLSDKRARTTADRVRAALVNSGLMQEAPLLTIRLEPPVLAGTAGELDLALALAALAGAGVLEAGLRWVLASGRLGLDGTVHARELAERTSLADVVASLCHTPVVGFEHMFERDER
jgi:magnesium chelatase family protein